VFASKIKILYVVDVNDEYEDEGMTVRCELFPAVHVYCSLLGMAVCLNGKNCFRGTCCFVHGQNDGKTVSEGLYQNITENHDF
jgi:hypothetical protein